MYYVVVCLSLSATPQLMVHSRCSDWIAKSKKVTAQMTNRTFAHVLSFVNRANPKGFRSFFLIIVGSISSGRGAGISGRFLPPASQSADGQFQC